MQGPAAIWQQSADYFERTLDQVGDDQWDTPTSCGDWSVRDLVDHTVFWQANLAAVVGADVAPEDGWSAVKSGIAEALADPAALEGAIEGGPMNGMPKHQGMGLAVADVLLHGWDLARTIGADETLPADAVASVQMGLSNVPEQMLRSPNMFGPAIDVPDDASTQDKLLGFAGRQP